MFEKMNDFLKRKSELDAEYAKQLQKLARSQKEEIAKKIADKANTGIFSPASSG